MPLSEHEQRLLEQMERALYAEDPKFASALRRADSRAHHRRRIVLASIAFLLGIVILMTGVIVKIVPVSVLGFLVMLGAAFVALSSWRAIPAAGQSDSGGSRAAGRSRPSASRRPGRRTRAGRQGFMERLEDRWNRRRDADGR